MEQLNLDDFEKAVLSSIKVSNRNEHLVYNMAYFIPCSIMTVLGRIYDPHGPWVVVGLLTYAILHVWMLRRQSRSNVACRSIIMKMESYLEKC